MWMEKKLSISVLKTCVHYNLKKELKANEKEEATFSNINDETFPIYEREQVCECMFKPEQKKKKNFFHIHFIFRIVFYCIFAHS